MSDKLLISTRRGLFTVCRNTAHWEIAAVDFLGDNVSITLSDPRDAVMRTPSQVRKFISSFRSEARVRKPRR
jgi:hypothetical protein